MQRPRTTLIASAAIAGPRHRPAGRRRSDRPVLVVRTPELRVGGHAVDIHFSSPATRHDVFRRRLDGMEFRPNAELNQALRILTLPARFGLGFGGRIERALRAVTLPR